MQGSDVKGISAGTATFPWQLEVIDCHDGGRESCSHERRGSELKPGD